MTNMPKVLIIDAENVLFPAEELYQDALTLAFADVTGGKVRFDKSAVKNILLGNSFMDIVEFAISFKPRMKITDKDREAAIRKFIEYTETFLVRGKNAGTKKEHLEVLQWFHQAEIPIVFCSNMSNEIMMKYLDATGYLSLVDYVITPDRVKKEMDGAGFPKPSKEMYIKILSRYGLDESEFLCIEGTLGGASACKFAKLNYIFCKEPGLFKLEKIKKALEEMELLTFQ